MNSNKHRCMRISLAAALLAPPASAWPQDSTLLDRINAYRDMPHTCEGQQLPAAGPLEPDAVLARVKLRPGSTLQTALKNAGYEAARAQAMVVSGASDAEQAMSLIRRNYCRELMSRQYSAAAVSHDHEQWTVILAQPLLSPNLGAWRQAGKQVLELVNEARGQSRSCGRQRFSAAPPLGWNQKLADAAHAHSKDMAEKNYFSHHARDGSDVGDRARRAGYAWRRIGENIAAGQGSPKQAVSAWLASPGHCANIMNPAFTEMGAAYAVNRNSDATIYWTQVLGTK